MSSPYAPQALHGEAASSLDLAAHGIFWTGIEKIPSAQGTLIRGQCCVEYFVPRALAHQTPIVLIHGGGQSTDFLTTPDGRPGWMHHFVNAGRAVYALDLPGHGRSASHTLSVGVTAPPASLEFASAMLTSPETNPHAWPQAKLHSQWPPGDDALQAFLASGEPMRVDIEAAQKDGQRCVAEVLDRVGRSILLTHSAGGPIGWLAMDARPDLVAAIVAVEPFGPPVTGMGPMKLPWGITAAPLTYDPPTSNSAELRFDQRPAPRSGDVACQVQRAPARQLPNLTRAPIVVITSEASWMACDGHGIVDYLQQAGATVEHLRLEDRGVRGNGHLPMMERNSEAVAAVISGWLSQGNL